MGLHAACVYRAVFCVFIYFSENSFPAEPLGNTQRSEKRQPELLNNTSHRYVFLHQCSFFFKAGFCKEQNFFKIFISTTVYKDANKLEVTLFICQPRDHRRTKNPRPPHHPPPPTTTHPTSDSCALQGFPKTLSSPGSLVWYQFWPSETIHLLLFQSEDVIPKMCFRGELSEAKEETEEEEDGGWSFDVSYKVSPVVILFTPVTRLT